MAVGSVWDWGKLEYKYFRVPGQTNLAGYMPLSGLGAKRRGVEDKSLGVDIEGLLPVLPPGSKAAGTGRDAVGRIYRLPGGALAGTADAAGESYWHVAFFALVVVVIVGVRKWT